MNAWQPIETAPKDGTSVLLYEPGHGIDVGHWYVHTHDEYKERPDGLFERVTVSNPGYWNCNETQRPTHWMPLPKVPE